MRRRTRQGESPWNEGPPLGELLASLSGEARRRILAQLSAGPSDVTTLARSLRCQMDTASRELGRLRALRLVQFQPESRRRIYRLAPEIEVDRVGTKAVLTFRAADGSSVTFSTPIPRPNP